MEIIKNSFYVIAGLTRNLKNRIKRRLRIQSATRGVKAAMTNRQTLIHLSKKLSDFESWQVFSFVTELSKYEYLIKADEKTNDNHIAEMQKIVNRREKGEPLYYIFGECEFYSLKFFVGEGVLIPRPETELLVDTVIDLCKRRENIRVLDLCSGSGAVAIAIEKNIENCGIIAVEKCEKAYSWLSNNIEMHCSKVCPVCADVFTYIPETKYDIIVSNPPYIKSYEIESLQKEVQREPQMALDGGETGLLVYNEILSRYKNYLNENGIIALEIGYDQKVRVEEIFKQENFTDITIKKDYNGHHRVIYGTVNTLQM